MPVYIGFSTQEVCQPKNLARPGANGGMGSINFKPHISKKFRLVDEQLVIRDFLNAFNIKQGDKVGQPQYGTTIWNYIFDPNTAELRAEVEAEIRRVATADPRINLNTIAVYTQTNGILVELEMAITPFNNATQVGFFLNRFNGSVQQVAQ